MTSEQLAGLHLQEALALLEARGVHPQVIISSPPRPPQHAGGRRLRVVRYEKGQLLCSAFRDAPPEEA